MFLDNFAQDLPVILVQCRRPSSPGTIGQAIPMMLIPAVKPSFDRLIGNMQDLADHHDVVRV
jgi:hypothetical protein